jgi:hypothetical protein
MGDIRIIREALHLLENDVLYVESTEFVSRPSGLVPILSSDPRSNIVLYLVISLPYRLSSDPS